MKKGFSTIMSAQFFSSLADNALFVAAVEMLRTDGAPEWQRAALVPMFALFYVVLAPFVGAFADAVPKGRVMFVSNAIKVVGCLMMLFGSHPLMAYAIVGLGAAAYSPAKYGILTELLPPSQLAVVVNTGDDFEPSSWECCWAASWWVHGFPACCWASTCPASRRASTPRPRPPSPPS